MTHLTQIARLLLARKHSAFSRARFSLLCATIILCIGTAVGSLQKCLAQPSTKLGVSFSMPKNTDNVQAAVNNLGPAAWYYDWASSNELTTPAGSPFVPMISLLPDFNAQELANVKRYGSTLLVGSEPPDPPQAWIAAWPQVLATKIRLGMPAGNDGWKAEFLREANARGYRVDIVCLHPYPDAGTPPNPILAANSLISYVQQWHNRYNKPIWLTEFALPPWGSPHTAEDNFAFMRNVLPRLEALPYIQKYCWWTTDWPYAISYECALANQDGTLTPQGVFYANFAKSPTSIPVAEGNYYLVPQNATKSRLDAGGGTATGTGTGIWPVNDARNQCWTFTSMGGSSYEIQPSNDTNLALELAGGSSANGTVAELHTTNGGSNQIWTATRVKGNIYTFSPQNAPGSCLEVADGNTANGTGVDIRQATGGKNQQWAVK